MLLPSMHTHKPTKMWDEGFYQGSCHSPCFEVHEHSSFSKAEVGSAKAQVHHHQFGHIRFVHLGEIYKMQVAIT